MLPVYYVFGVFILTKSSLFFSLFCPSWQQGTWAAAHSWVEQPIAHVWTWLALRHMPRYTSTWWSAGQARQAGLTRGRRLVGPIHSRNLDRKSHTLKKAHKWFRGQKVRRASIRLVTKCTSRYHKIKMEVPIQQFSAF